MDDVGVSNLKHNIFILYYVCIIMDDVEILKFEI